MYPPLADSIGNELRLKHGREYLIEVVLNGMAGAIEVNDTTYVGLMPEFASLSDDEIAAALNQVLTKFNAAELPKDFAPITAAEVHAARAKKSPRRKCPTSESHSWKNSKERTRRTESQSEASAAYRDRRRGNDAHNHRSCWRRSVRSASTC